MTKKDQPQRANLARRLFDNGVPLNLERGDQDDSVLLGQIGAICENCAFDLRGGIPGYMVNMRITVSREGFAIAGIVLELPWADCGLSLIGDPLESGARYNQYWFPGNDTLSFGRSEVINHHVNVRRMLRRGTTIEGLLLWTGLEPIPDAFVHGARFPASVIVYDQYDYAYPFEITLWADRSERVARDKQKRSSRPPLFSKRDRSPVPSRSENQEDVVETQGAGGVGRVGMD